MLLENKIISGRYKLLEAVGHGGMSTVYKAEDLKLNRLVAMKIMHTELIHQSEFIERFAIEAKANGRLSHRHIVNLYDSGNDEDTYYLVMEYVEGTTLKDVIAEKGAFKIDEAIPIMRKLCDALAHAHQHEIIHRDIKPHNILCSHTNQQHKVTDFGISRFSSSESNLTKTGNVMGSVHYFSPEQAQGHRIDTTSDLYSLGVVFYEMLTGQTPYHAPEDIAIALQHIQAEIPNPQSINKEIPDAVAKLIMKAMAKNPADRFQTASEMSRILQAIQQPKIPKSSQSVQAPASLSRSTKTVTTNKRKKRYWIMTTVAAILLLMFVTYQYADATFWRSETPVKKKQTEQTDTKPKEPTPTIEPVEATKQIPKKKSAKERQKTKSNKFATDNPKLYSTYIVVVGSFAKQKNADTLVQELQAKGIRTKIIRSTVFGKTMYRVHTGQFPTQPQAQQHLQRIKQTKEEHTSEAFVTKVEQAK